MRKFKINIIKATSKVLWIDTSRVWSMDTETWRKIAMLVLKQKIIVVDTGQMAEMLERYTKGTIVLNKQSKDQLSLYKTLVDGFTATDHNSFLGRQTKVAMTAFLNQSTEVEYAFPDLFDDLIRGLTPIYDEINKISKQKWGTPRAFKTLSEDIVEDWKVCRQEARSKKQQLQHRRNEELLGMHDALKKVDEGTDQIKKRNLVNYYIKKWKRISGNSDFNQMLEFFKSQYYATIPYVNIHSWIISDLIVGGEKLKSSDYFDAIMIPMILPFADFMLVDASMKNRIENKLKLVKPYGQYSCKLITLKELEEVLDLVSI